MILEKFATNWERGGPRQGLSSKWHWVRKSSLYCSPAFKAKGCYILHPFFFKWEEKVVDGVFRLDPLGLKLIVRSQLILKADQT